MPDSDIALTTPNQFAQASNGVTYAYRRFGVPSPAVPPLVLLQHSAAIWMAGIRCCSAPSRLATRLRNLRAAGTAIVTHRRPRESLIAIELAHERAGPILQVILEPYLKSRTFGRVLRPRFPVEPDSPVGAFINEARRHPVFELLEPAAVTSFDAASSRK